MDVTVVGTGYVDSDVHNAPRDGRGEQLPEVRQRGRAEVHGRRRLLALLEKRHHRRELEIPDERAQASLGPRQIEVMTELSQRRCTQPRLVRIDLPGMQIEDGGAPLDLVQPLDPPARPSIRKYPEVTAAGDREVERSPTDRRPRGPDERRARLRQIRMPGRYGNAVPIVADRKDAGVVQKAFFDEDIEGPQ